MLRQSEDSFPLAARPALEPIPHDLEAIEQTVALINLISYCTSVCNLNFLKAFPTKNFTCPSSK